MADSTPDKVEIPCAQCGRVTLKEPVPGFKRYCSRTCRAAQKRGGWLDNDGPQDTPPSPAYDRRSRLRVAVEDGTAADVIAAIRASSTMTDGGCWEWQGRLNANGYASVIVNNRNTFAHRIALEAHLGKKLGPQPAHHICANTACVNPDHLQPVTHYENTAEMLARNYMERRIVALEAALASLKPEHPLLDEVSIATR
jgi:endogenous inhibitor of DNA gyrase (YacG/DUF329 family)